MMRAFVAVLLGALMTGALFYLIDQADRAVPPPMPTLRVLPPMFIVPSASSASESDAPREVDGMGNLPERRVGGGAQPIEPGLLRPTATSAARAAAYSRSPAASAAESLLLSAIPSDIPDVVPALPGDATRVTRATDTPRAEGASRGDPSATGSASRGGTSTVGGAETRTPPPASPTGTSRAAISRHTPEPRYPERIRARGGEGTVSIRISIGADGAVSKVEVLGSSGDPGLRSVVIESVRAWTFDPALENGAPTASTLLRKFVFRLSDP